MRLIRRKSKVEAKDALRCPVCRERLFDDEMTCRMCGEAVPPLLRERLRDRAEAKGSDGA